jgi:hypothetical protein
MNNEKQKNEAKHKDKDSVLDRLSNLLDVMYYIPDTLLEHPVGWAILGGVIIFVFFFTEIIYIISTVLTRIW